MSKLFNNLVAAGGLLLCVLVVSFPKKSLKKVVLINSSSERVKIEVWGIELHEGREGFQTIKSKGYIDTGDSQGDSILGRFYAKIKYPIKVVWKFESQTEFQEKDFYEIKGLTPGTTEVYLGTFVVGINKAKELKVFFVSNRSSDRLHYQWLDDHSILEKRSKP
jgi:hypothetical protein